MTFEQAQTELQAILQRMRPGLSPAELLAIQTDLNDLKDAVRLKAEFDSIKDTINAVLPKVAGAITDEVIADIQSRDRIFKDATAALEKITNEGESNASQLSLSKTKIVLPAITKSVEEIKKIRDDVAGGKFDDAAAKAETLIVLLEQVKDKISAS
jgi:hypothetical protein